MRQHEVTCPVCSADIPLSGDETPGEEIFCTYCGAPCKLSGGSDDEELGAEEDF